jgi:hypothetical protein
MLTPTKQVGRPNVIQYGPASKLGASLRVGSISVPQGVESGLVEEEKKMAARGAIPAAKKSKTTMSVTRNSFLLQGPLQHRPHSIGANDDCKCPTGRRRPEQARRDQ